MYINCEFIQSSQGLLCSHFSGELRLDFGIEMQFEGNMPLKLTQNSI